MKDRRRYFRIEDKALLSYRVVEQEAFEMGKLALANNFDAPSRLWEVLLGIDAALYELVKQLSRENPLMAEAVELLNKKIGLVERMVTTSVEGIGPALNTDLPECEINLSASGMAVRSPSKLATSAIVELELILLPSYEYVKAYANVVDCVEQKSGDYRLAMQFVVMRDNDREVLIHHIFKKQSEALRQRRQGRPPQASIVAVNTDAES